MAREPGTGTGGLGRAVPPAGRGRGSLSRQPPEGRRAPARADPGAGSPGAGRAQPAGGPGERAVRELGRGHPLLLLRGDTPLPCLPGRLGLSPPGDAAVLFPRDTPVLLPPGTSRVCAGQRGRRWAAGFSIQQDGSVCEISSPGKGELSLGASLGKPPGSLGYPGGAARWSRPISSAVPFSLGATFACGTGAGGGGRAAPCACHALRSL